MAHWCNECSPDQQRPFASLEKLRSHKFRQHGLTLIEQIQRENERQRLEQRALMLPDVELPSGKRVPSPSSAPSAPTGIGRTGRPAKKRSERAPGLHHHRRDDAPREAGPRPLRQRPRMTRAKYREIDRASCDKHREKAVYRARAGFGTGHQTIRAGEDHYHRGRRGTFTPCAGIVIVHSSSAFNKPRA